MEEVQPAAGPAEEDVLIPNNDEENLEPTSGSGGEDVGNSNWRPTGVSRAGRKVVPNRRYQD